MTFASSLTSCHDSWPSSIWFRTCLTKTRDFDLLIPPLLSSSLPCLPSSSLLSQWVFVFTLFSLWSIHCLYGCHCSFCYHCRSRYCWWRCSRFFRIVMNLQKLSNVTQENNSWSTYDNYLLVFIMFYTGTKSTNTMKSLTFSTKSYRTLMYFCWRLKSDEYLYTASGYSQGDSILLTHTSVMLKLRNKISNLETSA